ncbi:hypothetical protein CI109_105502 [Kwoniella shandongensis]|uniref:General negative regulator of transcription subunit n=1 Tax=Kwoniella shandongensis TaxID=1734106 RepID=A0A5M6C3Q9_9TREE|nr:uncharacterized protein CI109_002223 [Kwoniella shandongensis]KAA5529330.1 hypothetical protein CI109_002223 [Kwoniella shandongensis]
MALRKLQAEIDRTLKSVATGVEVFEGTFDKLNHASNATQKDKLENDLKTQIKKLQRMRDQIKAWLGNGDIKDKTALLDNRKLIETQMERFKALEKEMKMKAFSKEGLIAQSKLDPAEKAKRNMIDWIGTTTDELARQTEQTEAELELLTATKKKKQAGDRLGELETLNERRQWHVGRLEVVQRMLENGQLSVENVEDIQEDVKYFLEANSEEDFDFDNGIYDELNLQEEEDYMPELGHDDGSQLDTASLADVDTAPTPAPAPKTPAKEEPPKKVTPAAKTTSSTSIHDDTPPSPVAARKTPSRKATLESKAAEPLTAKTPAKTEPVPPLPTSVSTPTPAPAPATVKPAALPPIRYAAAAAAAVASTIAAATSSTPSSAPVSTPPAAEATSPQKKDTIPVPETTVETPLSEKAPTPELTSSPAPESQSPGTAGTPAQTNGHAAPPPPPGLSSARSPQPSTQPSTQLQTPNIPTQHPANNGSAAPPGYVPQHAESSRAGSFGSAGQQRPQAQPGVMGNLMQSFEVAKEISKRRTDDVNELHAALDGSFNNIPQQTDAEPPRYYHPKNPIKTPSYYPQARLPILEDKSIYSRLELDQLFYIFYYMTGTYEQWLAARELKKQSWRFHKQYLTWFQRAHNPQAITEDYEQGGYYYFDWENSWCQRRKSDFRFEYRWLSDH